MKGQLDEQTHEPRAVKLLLKERGGACPCGMRMRDVERHSCAPIAHLAGPPFRA